jgi:hypothetical protein
VTAWLEGELGFKIHSGPLYNQLLKNDVWNALAKRFLTTALDERRL